MLDAPPSPAEDTFPKSFGTYVLLARLGSGGMGDVYLAKHAGIAGVERPCVVKTLREHLAEDREYVNRFIDEARVTVQLSHKNVCSVFDVGRIGRRYYLAMDLVVGRTLREVWERGATMGLPLEEGLALYLIGEVLEALDYAHRRVDPMTGSPLGIVHRDVSPQNVMVSVEGEVKLIDFGLAASSTKREKTEPNVVLGKMSYMSPEHARGDVVDASADQFAAAVLGYELMTGARYYEGLNTQQVWHTAGVGGFRPPRFDSLPEELKAILGRALAQERERRFPSCGEMREAIASYAFSRGLRSGPRDLRGRLQALFRNELDEVTGILRHYAHVQPPSTPAEAPGFEVMHIASTMPGTVPSELSVAAPLPPTTPTPTLSKEIQSAELGESGGPRRSTLWLAVAAVGCVALGGIIALAVGRTGDEPGPPTTVAQHTADALAEARTPPRGDDGAAEERQAAPPVASQVVEPPPPPRQEPLAAEEPRESATATKQEEPRRPRRHERARRQAPQKKTAPARPMTYSEKVLLLERCSDPCAKRALVNARHLAELETDEIIRTKRAVDRCAERCAP